MLRFRALLPGICLAVSTAVTMVSPAKAVLMQQDLLSAGDNLITLDTDTGLQWLDVDQTLGLTYDAVAAGAGSWTSLGFSHANVDQVASLFTNAGIVDLTNAYNAANTAAAETLVNLLGCTGNCSTIPFLQGAADAVPFNASQALRPLIQWFNAVPTSAAAHTTLAPIQKDNSVLTTGHYLIRAVPTAVQVPEPGTLVLFGVGLAGLFGASRRRAASSSDREGTTAPSPSSA